MIKIDIPMPRRCDACVCAYLIRTGPLAGETMCTAMEARGDRIEDTIIDYSAQKKPDRCPIRTAEDWKGQKKL